MSLGMIVCMLRVCSVLSFFIGMHFWFECCKTASDCFKCHLHNTTAVCSFRIYIPCWSVAPYGFTILRPLDHPSPAWVCYTSLLFITLRVLQRVRLTLVSGYCPMHLLHTHTCFIHSNFIVRVPVRKGVVMLFSLEMGISDVFILVFW